MVAIVTENAAAEQEVHDMFVSINPADGSSREVAASFDDAQLEQALEQDRIVPVYQPKIRLSDGALVGFEALARWRHPERGLVAPSAFQVV